MGRFVVREHAATMCNQRLLANRWSARICDDKRVANLAQRSCAMPVTGGFEHARMTRQRALNFDRISVFAARNALAIALTLVRAPIAALAADCLHRRSSVHAKFLCKVRQAMVPGDGIEPPTRGFSIRCSTN